MSAIAVSTATAAARSSWWLCELVFDSFGGEDLRFTRLVLVRGLRGLFIMLCRRWLLLVRGGLLRCMRLVIVIRVYGGSGWCLTSLFIRGRLRLSFLMRLRLLLIVRCVRG